MLIIRVLLILAAAAGYTLTGSMRFFLLEGVPIFLQLYHIVRQKKQQSSQPPAGEAEKKPHRRKILPDIPVILAAILIFFLPAPIALHSTMAWRYPFQRAYLNCYQNIQEPAWFPEFRGDIVSDYTMDYLASIMQGTGHFSVRYMTTPERAAELEKQFAAQSIYSEALPETADNTSFFRLLVPEKQWDSFSVPDADMWDGSVEIYFDRDFFCPAEQAQSGVMVYVLDAKCNWNHPASSVVIINSKTGAVQFSQFGWTALCDAQ
ncbi:MAG: hypothetical protein IKQ91_10960 [Oscillospiraceae bacterium]|nr:hypothetical protein [Oscillospiraceae bacterium]